MNLNLAVEPATDLRMTRAILRAGGAQALVQDLIDCAELALAFNDRPTATSLFGLVVLKSGLSPATLALLHSVQSRFSLWERVPERASVPIGGFAVDLAVSELQRLMRFSPQLAPPSTDFTLQQSMDLRGSQSARPLDPDRVALADRVATMLCAVSHAAAKGGLAELLLTCADEVLALSPIATEDFADSGTGTLAGMLALEGLRRFLVSNEALLRATPVGLFDAAAQLQPSALGPFFSNVGMLLRSTSDLFALVDAAAGGRADAETLECWAILLSAYLPESRLTDLAAEFGDRGMTQALHHLLARVSRGYADARPFPVLHGIRDAALDIDAFSLAGDAQQLAAQWHRVDPEQWHRLGEIRSFAGDIPAARAALEHALELDPSDLVTREQLALVETGEAIPLAEVQAAGRRALRQPRLAAFRAKH